MMQNPSARPPRPALDAASQTPNATMTTAPVMNSARTIRRRRVAPQVPYMSTAASRRTFMPAMASSPGGPARFHAQEEAGGAESPDCQFVQGQAGGERHGYQRRVCGESGGVPADDEPPGSHDHWLMQQVERQHRFVAVLGGTPPPGLGRRG